MKKLLKNKKGFTLMEMLIVVAIIVILVAISVPTFSANLNEAKEATDAANLRAAKSAAVIEQMNGAIEENTDYYYNIETGKVTETQPDAYSSAESGKVIKITVDTNGELTVEWSTAE